MMYRENYAASKKKIRWVIGFSKYNGEVEITLVHSISSGKKVTTINVTNESIAHNMTEFSLALLKTITEDGKRITEATGVLKTDFGHTWKSETCDSRLFRVEICTGYSTDPFEYTFSVDGIRYTDMIKKGKQNLYPGSIQSNDTNSSSSYSNDTSAAAARRSSTAVNGYSNGDARRSSVTKPFASTATNDDNTTNNLPSKPTPAAADRGNFQSPPADADSFDFFGAEESSDPFAEPPSRPATKPSTVAQKLFAEPPQPRRASTAVATPSFDPFASTPKQATPSFDPFAESPKQASATVTPSFDPFASNSHSSGGVDPFATTFSGSKQQAASSSDPFSNPASDMTSSPNFMDDFSPGPVSTAPSSNQQKPSRRASATDISLGFAGMSFAAAPPQPPVTTVALSPFPAAAAEHNLFEDNSRVDDNKTAPAVESDPWADSKLVNLDLTGKTTAASSTNYASTVKGPSLSSMMTGGPLAGANNATLIPSKPMSGSSSLGSSQSAMNARASFIGQSDVPFQAPVGTRSSFIAPMQGRMGMGAPMQGGMGMGSPMQGGMGMGAPMQGGMGMGSPMQGGMGMGAPMQGGMGMGAPMQGGMGMGAPMQGGMGMGAPMQGGMGMGPRSSFIATSNNQQMNTRGSLIPTPASKSNAPQSSLDSLNPFA
jgi:hypothetical protein